MEYRDDAGNLTIDTDFANMTIVRKLMVCGCEKTWTVFFQRDKAKISKTRFIKRCDKHERTQDHNDRQSHI